MSNDKKTDEESPAESVSARDSDLEVELRGRMDELNLTGSAAG
jgi:hypothetical protein